MARILVTGDHSSVAGRDALAHLVERMQRDGHDAFVFGTDDEDVAASVRGCDAVVGIIDRIDAGGAALMACAHAQKKPVLGLAGDAAGPHPVFQEIATVRAGPRVEAWLAHLPEFYDRIRPFAGRVVRDRIPQLVKEAGHDVTFRRLTDDEKPRFLKQKVANEAQELLGAGMGDEKEEVGDVLEALEAFILARGFDRDDLRRVKEAKRKRRGGFEQGYVVEATARPAEATPPQEQGEPRAGGAQDDRPGKAQAESREQAEPLGGDPPSSAAGPGDGQPMDFEYGNEEPHEEDPPENIAPEKKLDARFTDL